jgi:hypothetical protein
VTILDFLAGYQPPGTYFQFSPPPLLTSSPTTVQSVALVGPTRGYLTQTDAISITSTPAALSQAGINTSTIVVTNVSGTVYTSSNYTIATNGTTTSLTATIALAGGSSIVTGTLVYVTYQYTNINYYIPQTFTNYSSLVNAYGSAFDANNNLLSPIALAAQLLYSNGTPTIIVAPTTDTSLTATRTGLSGAYANIASISNIDIVVPITNGLVSSSDTGAAGDLKIHCDSLSAEGLFRIGIYGADKASTTAPDTLAASVGDARVVEVWPNQLLFNNGASNQNVTVGGYCLAAACAGILASNLPQQGLTKQNVSGFAGIPLVVLALMTPSYKNQLSAAGVSVVESVPPGILQVRHGVSTLSTSVLTREISVTRASDFMLEGIIGSLNAAGIIGSPITVTTQPNVHSIVQSALDGDVATGLIYSYTNLTTQIFSVNPTVLQVSFAYQPSYPLDYIVVTYTVNLSTGLVAAA